MRVYHFLPSKHALSNIENRRLKIAQYEELNDPFEMYGCDFSDARLRNGIIASRLEMNSSFGILCFSRGWSNPMLWSHYADGHRGICLGLDVSCECAREVMYADHRLKWSLIKTGVPLDSNEEQVTQLLYTKYSVWSYEQEVCVYTDLKDKDPKTGLYFAELNGGLVLREAILGCKCGVKASELQQLVSGWKPSVEVFRAALAADTFKVIPATSDNR